MPADKGLYTARFLAFSTVSLGIGMLDRHGNLVHVGDEVRVLEIPPEVLATLAPDERPHIESMLNNVFVVDDLPEEGKVSVSITWEEGEGHVAVGGLYMLPHEFELVRKAKIDPETGSSG